MIIEVAGHGDVGNFPHRTSMLSVFVACWAFPGSWLGSYCVYMMCLSNIYPCFPGYCIGCSCLDVFVAMWMASCTHGSVFV